RREQMKKLRAISSNLLRFRKIDNFSLQRKLSKRPMVRNRMTAGKGWMQETRQVREDVSRIVMSFAKWLDIYGETSWDHQSFFAGPVGGWAKSLYYRNSIIGAGAVAPIIFFEALLPSARRFFHHPTRFPIADAHYVMGFACLYQITNDNAHLQRAIHFLEELKKSRSPGFTEYCWGYPFDWATRNGLIKEGTPLITTTPYCYEAFLQVSGILESEDKHEDLLEQYKQVTQSIARHAFTDIKDFPLSKKASSCSY